MEGDPILRQLTISVGSSVNHPVLLAQIHQ